MLIDGEKYACEACVRGHRVSNCQHSDRPLTHINKKGRPVSQCQHCRSLRKSRSAHAKCDCGDKNHNHNKGPCPHLKDLQKDVEQKILPPDNHCCCGHGGRCTCALKKEQLDTVPEGDGDDNAPANARRPRAYTTQSDNSLTVFTNGHHKPAVKHNKMAHQCGLPYVVPRVHGIHGSMTNRSVDNLPHTSTIDALHGDSHIKDSMMSAQQEQRKVKSEHNSPVLSATSTFSQLNGQLPPLDMSTVNDADLFPMFDNLSALPEHEAPMFSAGLSSSASIDWSHYPGLDFNNDSFVASPFSQVPSYSNFDFSSVDQPTLTTTSTSGEISEAEDFGLGDNHMIGGSRITDVNSEYSDPETYQISKQSSFIGLSQQQQLLSSTDMDEVDLNEFLTNAPPSSYAAQNVNAALSISPFEDKGMLVSIEDDLSLPLSKDDGLWMASLSSTAYAMDATDDAHDQNVWVQ